jgi:lambda family phage portal protein
MMAKRPGIIRRAWESLRALVGAGGSGEDLFKGASSNRLNWDWVTSALSSADDEVRAGLRTLRSRSRALARNSAMVRKYLNLVKINVIGPNGFGIAASFMKGKQLDTELNTTIEKAWRRWAEGPVTLDGTMNLKQLQRLLARSVAIDGEVFVRMWIDRTANRFAFALEPIDADLVDDSFDRPGAEGVNEVKMGIEVDSKGRRVAYHVISNERVNRQRTPVPASEMLHLFDPERVHQHRGLPWIYGVMHRVKMLEGYYEAELVAARAAAAKMGFFVR